ncbi:MAG: hypothetical protein SWY16_13155 [Cyanobacteriota bacterium]|nr:hypothetical protein [Cyanobacteriota bacterium]
MRKFARIEFIRDWVVARCKSQSPALELSQSRTSIFQNVNVDEAVSALQTDGCHLGIDLPADILQELQDFAKTATCYGDRNPELGFKYDRKESAEAEAGQKFKLGSYMDTTEYCPAFQKLKNDPVLLAIAAKYLGTEPLYAEHELCWSFPVPATPFEQLKAAQVFHYDIDDYRCVKFFFYLTDVDTADGPHVCIRGTHKNKKWLHQIIGERCASIDDDKLVEQYGPQNVETIVGKAGSGFVEDIFCFHKGTLPSQNERLLLQIEFTMHKYKGLRFC